MAYEEALARIMLVMPAPGPSWSGESSYRVAGKARLPDESTQARSGKLRSLQSRGWIVGHRPGYTTYWRLTPKGAEIQRMMRIVRDRTVESPAWP